MINLKPVIALVPARGGSKGVPRKNLRHIVGRSLVEITIMAALDAKLVDCVYLTSEDKDILAVGLALGIKIVKRPNEIATDSASAIDVVRHFIAGIPAELSGVDPYIVYLQPTSPLRLGSHIDNALSEMVRQHEDTLVSVVELKKSPYKSFALDKHGRLQALFDEALSNARRQDLPKSYTPNGAIYVFRVSDFNKRNGFPSNGSLPFIMNEIDSIDIDSEEDIRYVERYLGEKHG
jgi:CMP-N-acetylneuraminic acid synthetase